MYLILWQSNSKNKEFVNERLTQTLAVLLNMPTKGDWILSYCRGCAHPSEGSLPAPR